MKYYRILILFLSLVPIVGTAQKDFKSSSVLKSGKWYKIKVNSSGIYKLTYDDLVNIGFQTPENIRVYGNVGEQLSDINDNSFTTDLEELPLYSSNSSGFSSGDYYLFYAQGPNVMDYHPVDGVYRQNINNYSEWNYLYLTSSFGAGKRIEQIDNSALSASISTNSYDWHSYHELELRNLIQSGSQWFGEKMKGLGDIPVSFNINNLISSEPVLIEANVAARSAASRSVGMTVNGNRVSTLSFSSVNIESHETTYASTRFYSENITVNNPALNISFGLVSGSADDEIFLDYVRVNARARLKIANSQLKFRDSRVVGANSIAEFNLEASVGNVQVWNITNPVSPFKLKLENNSGKYSFKDNANALQEYIAFDAVGQFSAPLFIDEALNDVGWLEKNQNLHAAATPEYLIVTHPAFIAQANQLANLHRNKDNMSVLVVTTTEVYNEFSSGKPEAGAIRNFARMLYERSSTSDSLKYLLLFGDGSYDNKRFAESNPNYIPTYQSISSLSATATYVADDYYGLLEPDLGGITGKLCVGVGRIPVTSDGGEQVDAQGVVDKIRTYYNTEIMSDWRNNMIFLGDDGESSWDETLFMEDSDKLTKIVAASEPSMNIRKVYLDAYTQISSSTGAAYPEVEMELNEAFNNGALLFNYMGHGGDEGITQEAVYTRADFLNMQNAPYFPLFVTATCQLSRFDDVEISEAGVYSQKVSAGEVALLNPDGGAIAMLSTTRLVYQSSNMKLSTSLYNILFDRDVNGNRYRLGDLLRIAKNNTIADRTNTFKFALLGDPAITLAYGDKVVIADTINQKSIAEFDTLTALSEVTVQGYIADADSALLSDFNGLIYASVYDKPYMVTTNSNDGQPQIEFEVQDKLLYRGKASVTDGRFKVSFKVPKDITYSFGSGKVSFYAQNEQSDAIGYTRNFIIGGTNPDADPDNDGPELALYMNNTHFQDGGVTDNNPVLVAHVYDTNGINTTGNGIGHDLVAVLLDDNQNQSFILNDYFVGDEDNYRRGEVHYQLSDLESGYHEIKVRVWDTYNNSTEQVISFYVETGGSLFVSDLEAYPNPARDYTTFQYSHNLPDEKHYVTIDIFDATGRLIKRIEREQYESGYVSEPLEWNLNSDMNSRFAAGVYPYRVTIHTESGKEAIQSSRLIIIP